MLAIVPASAAVEEPTVRSGRDDLAQITVEASPSHEVGTSLNLSSILVPESHEKLFLSFLYTNLQMSTCEYHFGSHSLTHKFFFYALLPCNHT